MAEEKKGCPCPNTTCERNTKCKECQAFHHGRGQKTRCGK